MIKEDHLGKYTELISSGSTPKGGSDNYLDQGEILFIRSQNVLMNKFSDHDALYIPSNIHEKMKRTWVKNGDVLLNITGASIGRTTVYVGEDNKANVNQHVCIIRLKDFETVDPFYLSYFLASPSFQRSIMKINAGATRQALNFSQISKFKIPILPIQAQKKIVEILKKGRNLKNWRVEVDELVDDYLKSLFSDLFGDMSNKDPKFPIKSLKCKIDILTGYAFKSKDFIDEGIPVIKIGTVNKGFFDIKTFSFLPSTFLNSHKNYIIFPGDLLISLTGTTGKEDYGNVCFAENQEEKYLLNQRVAKISVNELIFNKYYLYFAFKHPAIKLELIKSNRGIRQANISKEDILKLKVPVPPIELQNQFASIVQQVEVIKSFQSQSKQEIDNLFNTLMQKAFKGELVC